MAPTLRRCAGRCPPRGLIRLGTALRQVGTPRAALGFTSLLMNAAGRLTPS
jgi:hypothetical protein